MSKRFHPVKITPGVYRRIKSALDTYSVSREMVCRAYSISYSTCKYIDQSKNYQDYQRILAKYRKASVQKKQQQVENSRRLRESIIGMARVVEYERQIRLNRQRMVTFACAALAVGILVGFFVFVLVGGAK